MPRLSRAHAAARFRILDAAAAGLPPDRLAARIMAAVGGAIPLDGFRLFGVDPATMLVNRLLAASDTDDWARAEWLRDVYLRAETMPSVELPTLMRAGLSVVAHQPDITACWGYPAKVLATLSPPEHTRRFHELRSPLGGTLMAVFSANGRWVAALQAYRRDPTRLFRPSEVGFVELMSVVIGKALGVAIAREAAERIDYPAASGIMMLDADANPTLVTPAAEVWVAALRDAGQSAHAPLPTPVWSALAALRAGGQEGVSAVVTAATAAGPARIEAAPAGLDGAVAIVIMPAVPLAPPSAPDGWPLSPSERRVVDLALGGRSNAAIADTLHVSEQTVAWQLRQSYGKLGVRSRTGLLARLFEERPPPGLLPDPAAPGHESRGASGATPRR